MGKSILITGGARSGKSTFAEHTTLALGAPALYIATAEAHDDEMRARIAEHQARRGADWTTIAEPLALTRTLSGHDAGPPVLVDCLTLWLTNLILSDTPWQPEVEALANAIPNRQAPVVFVTNEVGSGIVPENALARRFRDAAGQMNQQNAAVCDELWLCVSGHPVQVKPQ